MVSDSISRSGGLNSNAAIKLPCVTATTANITLYGLQIIDGLQLIKGNRVLVKNQTDNKLNGIYVAYSTDWVRAQDFDGARDVINGTTVYIAGGTVGGKSYYQLNVTDNPVSFGTSAITFTLINVPATINDGSITNAKLADMAANTIKGRSSATTGPASDITIPANSLFGRAATGNITPITFGNNIGLTGTTLNVSGFFQVGDATGTVDAIAVDYSPDLTVADKAVCAFVSIGRNTSSAPTFSPDGNTPRPIVKQGGQVLSPGDIGPIGFVGFLEYNAANFRWELINPVFAGPYTQTIDIAAGTAFIDILNIDSDVDIEFCNVYGTALSEIIGRVSTNNGGSFNQLASAYNSYQWSNVTAASGAPQTYINVSFGNVNITTDGSFSGVLKVQSPQLVAQKTRTTVYGGMSNDTQQQVSITTGRRAVAEVNNAFRLQMLSGNFQAGILKITRKK